MFKGRLIIEQTKGTAVDREITLAEGEGLLFKMNVPVGPDTERIAVNFANRIEKFLNGDEKFLVVFGDVEIIKLATTGQGPAA